MLSTVILFLLIAGSAFAQKCSAPKNIIVLVGDGNGWEMTRATAIHKRIMDGEAGTTLADFYTEGKGSGLSFQTIENMAITTTANTYIDGDKGNSANIGNPLDHNTGSTPLREGFEFSTCPAAVNGFYGQLRNMTEDIEVLVSPSGNLPYYSPELGSAYPWIPLADPEFIKALYPHSAGTSTALCSGVKTYVGAIGVDIYEIPVKTSLELAAEMGKSTGIVTSVPYNHATPAAAAAHVSQRNKYHEGSAESDLDEFNMTINPNDNIFMEYMKNTQPTVILGGGHPLGASGDRYISEQGIADLRAGGVYPYTFLERAPGAVDTLMETAAALDPEDGDKLFGLYGCRGQTGNLCWRTANSDYSNAGLRGRLVTERELDEGETDDQFIAREVDENPGLANLTAAALAVLKKDADGFWLMVEGGDIDWAAHDNSLDNLIGAVYDFHETVQIVLDWIADNGGFEETMLIISADHDHYLTLNDDYPALLAQKEAENLTAEEDPVAAGHFWGADPAEKYGWGTHTTRPVPSYYAGACTDVLDDKLGEGYEVYGHYDNDQKAHSIISITVPKSCTNFIQNKFTRLVVTQKLRFICKIFLGKTGFIKQ
eukprot:TRINITY_DN3230_c0_g1_i4.p1 TRINITY_DN3230_c0_g1~~TRINITY_DN3230_c0_g1_i4.p1  ORF type:complete len:599 (-),score=107.25 TRINITY_DN3230_c0_g1_i4:739-2535(-)